MKRHYIDASKFGRKLLAAAILLGLGSVGICEAAADPARTTWTTFLYAAPSYHAVVVDEVPQASAVDAVDCRDGWCRVTMGHTSGYIRSDIVAGATGAAARVLPQPAAAIVPLPSGPCFEANQTGGNGGNARTVVCAKGH